MNATGHSVSGQPTGLLKIKHQDLAALQAIRDAMFACDAADTTHLQYQHGGTYGFMHNGLIDAATALFNQETAERLMEALLDGDTVEYCLNQLRDEMCPVCKKFPEYTYDHCGECGVCAGENHNVSCSELVCLGHSTTDGPMGVSAFCDGTCRPQKFVTP